MARDSQVREADEEASPLSRREYLRATGILAGTSGLGMMSSRAAGATSISVDVISKTVNHSWETVQLANSYDDPIVVAGPASYNGSQPTATRLRTVTPTEFDLSLEEWLYLDGAHRYETIGCLVTDPGVYSLADGTELVVGRVQTDHRWTASSFTSSFSTTPIVFSQVQTVNGYQPVVTRHRKISGSEFGIRLQEEEAKGPHRTEEIGYLAIEPGTGTINGQQFEAGVQTDVNHTWQTITFGETYQQPVFLADMQTYSGWNTCTTRYRNLTESSVEVKVEEEQSADSETAHVGEQVGYLVVEGAEDATTTGFGVGVYGDGGFGQ